MRSSIFAAAIVAAFVWTDSRHTCFAAWPPEPADQFAATLNKREGIYCKTDHDQWVILCFAMTD